MARRGRQRVPRTIRPAGWSIRLDKQGNYLDKRGIYLDKRSNYLDK
jgi:hypothetical protein